MTFGLLATDKAAACANWLLEPTTKFAKLYLRLIVLCEDTEIFSWLLLSFRLGENSLSCGGSDGLASICKIISTDDSAKKVTVDVIISW